MTSSVVGHSNIPGNFINWSGGERSFLETPRSMRSSGFGSKPRRQLCGDDFIVRNYDGQVFIFAWLSHDDFMAYSGANGKRELQNLLRDIDIDASDIQHVTSSSF